MTTPQKTSARQFGHRLSFKGYACILRLVMRRGTDHTSVSVSKSIRVGEGTARDILARMDDLGLIHEAGRQSSIRGPKRPIYAFGPRKGFDGKPVNVMAWNRRPELMAFANVIWAVKSGPTTAADIMDLAGLCRGTVYGLMRHCHEIGLVHIGDWHKPPSGPPVPMYAIGKKPDKPRPLPVPSAEVWRKCDARRRLRNQQRHAMAALAGVLPEQAMAAA